MKTKLPLLLAILMTVALSVSAQIKGTIHDNMDHPIEYVNVALFSLPDTTLIGGSVTDSVGNFTIASNEIENTFLQISMLGYETQRVTTKAFQNIVLQPSSEYLDEVVIEGERPPLKVEQGKLIYHVPSLLKNKPVTNAYDALKEIPGVVEQGENLMLIGASGMTVLLNGQKTSMSYQQLMNLLRSIPLSRIEDVEIMHSAPPQYNIRGAAINVVLKQTANEETENMWQGEIAGEYQQRTHASGNGRVSLLYLGKNISFDALYSDRYNKIENREFKTNDHTVNNQLHYITEQNKGINRNNSHNVRTALAATLVNKDKIEVAYTGIFDNPKGYRIADIAIDDKKIHSDTHTSGPSRLNNLKADYTSHFGLSAGIDYTNYDDKSQQDLTNKPLLETDPQERYISDSHQQINKVFVYANQTHALPNSLSINYGMNYSYAASKNFAEAYINDESYDLSTFQNRQYENIWNVFAGFSKSFSQQFSMQASLAAEFYKTEEESDNKRETLWDGTAFFPTISATYMPSMRHIFQFSLSSDKQYPPYWALNSMVYPLNAYSEVHGNPQLKPARIYNTRLNYIFKRKYVLMAFLNYLPDHFTQIIYQRPDELKSEIKYQNMDYQRMEGMAAIVPFKVGEVLDSKLTVNGIHMTHKMDDFYDIPFDRSVWFGQFKLDNDFKLSTKPDIRFNLSGTYTTPAIQGIMDLSDSYHVSGGLTWTFDHEHAKLILRATDIFESRLPFVTIDYKGQKGTMDTFQDTRMVSLSFVYRFGGFKEKERKEVDTSRYGVE